MIDSQHRAPSLYRADYVYAEGRLRRDVSIAVDASGRIAGLVETSLIGPVRDFGAALLVPGMVNSHSHAFQVLLRGRSERAVSFRDWVDHHLYALVERMTPTLVYQSAVLAFAEMLLEGVTSVGEFFYLNRLDNRDPHAGARQILAAADTVGIRACLLRALYDRRSRAAQERFCEPVAEALAAAREMGIEARERGHGFGIAPHSLHGATEEMIRRGHELANELDCPFHIHLAEQRSDLHVAQEYYGTTPLRALDRLGVIDARLTCVHGVWLDEKETRLLGDRGGGLAYNPRSNMALGDGIAPIREMLDSGVRVSLGIDGPGANNQAGILHELRTAEGLARLRRAEMNQLAGREGREPEPGVLMALATKHGGQNLGLDAGDLSPGQWADFLVVDIDDPSLWPWSEDEPETLLWNYLLSSAPRACIRHVYVGGRQVVSNGKLALVDLDAEIGGRLGLARRSMGE